MWLVRRRRALGFFESVLEGIAAPGGGAKGEHASVTPLRQKRFFKDLSPPQMSPPDSGDGVISPLQGGSEGRHQSTFPSVFDSGRKESAARDPDVEAGASEERGRVLGIGDVHTGQGDGDKATGASGVLPQGDVAGSCGELDEVTYGRAAEGGPGIRGSMNRTKWKNFKKAAARINTRDQK